VPGRIEHESVTIEGRVDRTARRRLLAAAGLALVGTRAEAAPQAAPEAGARIRDILERARGQAGAAATPPEQRAALLAAGERALAEGNADAASALFEQAGFIKHAADAELGLIRSFMQQGEYRRALAFAAHTAGAHPDVAAGSALYAWLLHVGGQARIATMVVDRARARRPDDHLLIDTQALLAAARPRPAAALLEPPARFAPFSPASSALPAAASVRGSGVLVDGGRRAFTAASAVASAKRVWVRNGRGQVGSVHVTRIEATLGLAVLELAEPIGVSTPMPIGRDPFPGSPGYLVEYPQAAGAEPTWPLMRIGFLGAATTDAGIYALGIEVPAGPRGGPVFGSTGQWIGLAVAHGSKPDTLVLASQLRRLLADVVPDTRAQAATTSATAAADEVYERALPIAVEVIAEA
jgi:tetratricopeptide (TPR) repeat protein